MKSIQDYKDIYGFINNNAYDPIVKKDDWLLQFQKVDERTCIKSKNNFSLYYSSTLNLYALVNDGMSNNRFYIKEMWIK